MPTSPAAGGGAAVTALPWPAMPQASYGRWIKPGIMVPGGPAETGPDMPLAGSGPVALGHSGKVPLGRRVVVPGDNPTNALAPATGFVSTAGDLARLFAQLDPAAK